MSLPITLDHMVLRSTVLVMSNFQIFLKCSPLKVQKILSTFKCLTVRLERQVGCRYFVTAANGSKALFLDCAALEYFKFNGVTETNGNKLEKELYLKLQDQFLLASIKADALMFYFVYADLVTLAKSNELGKSAYGFITSSFKFFLKR